MQTGETGYTLAAVLLLGKDKVITSIIPHFKTDAIVRIHNTDRTGPVGLLTCHPCAACPMLFERL